MRSHPLGWISQKRFAPGRKDVQTDAVSPSETDLSDIVVVGELTTASGPLLDDHFLVLVRRNGEWWEIPSSEAGAVILQIESELGVIVSFELAHKTGFESRVIHPEDLRGKPLFAFREKRDRASILKQIARLGVSEVEKELALEVARFVRSVPNLGS